MELAKGMRDFQPEEAILRKKILARLTNIFELHGFNPVDTPIIERWETLSAKYGASDETDVMKEVYRLKDQGERELGLRFDLTVPTARFVGMNPQLKLPFKRYQIGPVFRDGPIKLGRYREFVQCDFDTFGSTDTAADSEILNIFLQAFEVLELPAKLAVNDVRILQGLISYAGIPQEQAQSAIITLDKLAKIGSEGVKKELKEKGVAEENIDKLLGAVTIEGTNQEKFKQLLDLVSEDNIAHDALLELKETLKGLDEERVDFSPALARGLAYYTGIIYEGFLTEGSITSSICAGGRYDKLISQLQGSNQQTPAIGGSFGIEPITEYLKEKAKGEQGGYPKTVTKLYVVPIKCYSEAQPIVKELRQANINTEIDVMGRGISKNLEYANALDIPYVAIIGKKELEAGKITLKDMHTSEEILLTKQELIKKLS